MPLLVPWAFRRMETSSTGPNWANMSLTSSSLRSLDNMPTNNLRSSVMWRVGDTGDRHSGTTLIQTPMDKLSIYVHEVPYVGGESSLERCSIVLAAKLLQTHILIKF